VDLDWVAVVSTPSAARSSRLPRLGIDDDAFTDRPLADGSGCYGPEGRPPVVPADRSSRRLRVRGSPVRTVRDSHESHPTRGGDVAPLLRDLAGRRNGPDNGHDAGTGGAHTRVNGVDSTGSTDAQSTASASRRGGARRISGPAKRWTPPTDAPRRLFALPEAAAYLGLSPWTVRSLQWKGKLPRVDLGRKLLFDRADLDALIERQKERP
jgi:excisionase family DNA binding protein